MVSSVESWFGKSFHELHPKLQNLHRAGGVLEGEVEIGIGSGMAHFLGLRLASKLGIPTHLNHCPFRVEITHRPGSLGWSRRFGTTATMQSEFAPQGCYPDGHWLERTGDITLELGVLIKEGSWFWVQRGVRFRGWSIPLFILPRTTAYKRINDEQYEFSVEFHLPILGRLLWYRGFLNLL